MSIPGGWYQTKGTFETCPKRGRNLLVFFGKEAESVMPLLRTILKLNLQHPLPIDTSKPNTAHTPRKSNPLLEGIFYFYFRCFYVTLPGGFSSLVFLIIDTATTRSGLFWLIKKLLKKPTVESNFYRSRWLCQWRSHFLFIEENADLFLK